MHFIRSSAAAWKWKVKRVGKMTIINVMLYCKWFELSQRRGKGRNNGVESYVSILRFVFLMRTNWPNKVFHFTHIHYFYFLFILLCSQYFPFSSTTEHKWLLLYKNAAFTLLIALSTFNSTSTHNQLESVMWNLLRIFSSLWLSLSFNGKTTEYRLTSFQFILIWEWLCLQAAKKTAYKRKYNREN